MTARETELLLAVASACKQAGMLDAELPPSEMVTQAKILIEAFDAQGLTVTLKGRCDLGGPYDPCYDPLCPDHGAGAP